MLGFISYRYILYFGIWLIVGDHNNGYKQFRNFQRSVNVFKQNKMMHYKKIGKILEGLLFTFPDLNVRQLSTRSDILGKYFIRFYFYICIKNHRDALWALAEIYNIEIALSVEVNIYTGKILDENESEIYLKGLINAYTENDFRRISLLLGQNVVFKDNYSYYNFAKRFLLEWTNDLNSYEHDLSSEVTRDVINERKLLTISILEPLQNEDNKFENCTEFIQSYPRLNPNLEPRK